MNLSENPSIHLFLARINAQSSLSGKEQQAILDLGGHPAQAKANVDFVRLGEHVDHACLIVEGLVARFGQDSEGQRQITAMHIPGDMVDLHSVAMPQSSAPLLALTTTTMIQIPHAALRAVAHAHPAIAEAFWRDSLLDAAILSEWLVNIGRRHALARTAHLICEMAVRYRQIGRCAGLRFELPMTQTHLADALALTSVHVNRTLKALKEEGLVEFRHRTVVIHDWDGLAQIGDFDPAYLKLRSHRDERQFEAEPMVRGRMAFGRRPLSNPLSVTAAK